MPKRFVIADTHFSHKNILTFEPHYRGARFKNVEEMDEFIIKQWNETVAPEDTVYHLGDVAFADGIKHIKRLNGKKFLVMGNHDNNLSLNQWKEVGFENVFGFQKLKNNGFEFILTHCPLHPDEISYYPNATNVHGHIHSRLVFLNHLTGVSVDGRYINVGVELTDFKPVDVDDLFTFYNKTLLSQEVVERAKIKTKQDRERLNV